MGWSLTDWSLTYWSLTDSPPDSPNPGGGRPAIKRYDRQAAARNDDEEVLLLLAI